MDSIEPRVREILPLSPLQQGLLFHALFDVKSPDLYTAQIVLELEGRLDENILRSSAMALLQRHGNLRACFYHEDLSQPIQVVADQVSLPWETIDLSSVSENDREQRLAEFIASDRTRRFDPASAPLLRFALIRLAGERYKLVFTNHHLLMDGWSLPVFLEELFRVYEQNGDASELPPVTPYREYLEWVIRRDRSAARSAWAAELYGLQEPTLLCSLSPGGSAQTPQQFVTEVPKDLTGSLARVAKSQGLTLNTIVEGLWGLLLSLQIGRNDVVFGATVGGRTPEVVGIETMVGFFINTVPVRVRLRPGMPLMDVLKKLQSDQSRLIAHQYLGLLEIQRLAGMRSLFDTLVVFENYPLKSDPTRSFGGVRVVGTETFDASHYPLSLVVVPGACLGLRLSYRSDLFEQSTVKKMAETLVRFIDVLVANDQVLIGQLGLLESSERQQILVEWNETEREIEERALPELFEEQVERTPDAVAVVFEEANLSYRELNARANQLAHLLVERGIGPEDVVALAVPRSLDLLIGLLGILKSGAAYLPLDLEYPAGRLAFMLKDAKPACVVTVCGTGDGDWATDVPRIRLDEDKTVEELRKSAATNVENGNRARCLTAQNPCYVIYTSGSTGTAKGVTVSHSAVVNHMLWMSHANPLVPSDRVLQKTSCAFDASVWEFYAPILCGACLVVAPPRAQYSSEIILQLVEDHEISVLQVVPTLLAELVRVGGFKGASLKHVFCGGESLSRDLAERFFLNSSAKLHNLYGPTEATVDSTWSQHDRRDKGGISIGRPIWNTRAYVLDENLEPVPIGVAGELYLAGKGLARGYLGRPRLTGERFVANPFESEGSRMYRTGDVVRWRSDGELEFLGRADQQVKIRGFRIELGEIEATLRSSERVQEAVVIAREDLAEGEKRLVGYVVSAAGQVVDENILREELREKLPEYMVPAVILMLDAFPLTASGKVDRKALPKPEMRRRAVDGEYVKPRNETQELVAKQWEQILKLEKVGIEDNFFELGGDSLTAMQLASRIREVFGIGLPLRVLFEKARLVSLAEVIETELRGGKSPRAMPLIAVTERTGIPLSYAQERLWFLNQLVPNSAFYNMSTALRLEGELDGEVLERIFKEIVRRHEVLRTRFVEVGGRLQQDIVRELTLELRKEDLSGFGEAERLSELKRLAREEAIGPFDLAEGPMIRAKLVRTREQEHILLFTIHHIVSDGWSKAVLIREVSELYRSFSEGRESPLQPLVIQYADYAVWERSWLQGEVLEQQLSYWRERLRDAVMLELPTDRPRPLKLSYEAGAVCGVLSEGLTAKLRALSQQEGVTLFMTLLAGFQVVMHRYSGQEDIVVGTLVANRNHPHIEPLIGFFVNTLALRTDLSGNPRFRELLKQEREMCLGAYAHQDLPFEKLVAELHPTRDLSRSPLFQIVFAMQNAPQETLVMSDLRVVDMGIAGDMTRFDLEFNIWEVGTELQVRMVYSKDLYERATVERLLQHYTTVLEGVVEDAEQRIGELPLLGESEWHELVAKWNETEREIEGRTLPELFEEQVERTPDAVAVVFEEANLSYRELNARANQLAWYLREQGVGPEDCVGVCLERSIEMLVGVLGVVKAGGVYVPLDPRYPFERLTHMVRDSGVKLILTLDDICNGIGLKEAARCVPLDADWASISKCSRANPDNRAQADNLVYILYTSGSTGRPKGVGVTHRGLHNYLNWSKTAYVVEGDRGAPVHSPLSFDLTITSLFLPILSGQCVTLLRPTDDAEQLATALAQGNDYNLVKLTPSHLRVLKELLSGKQLDWCVRLLVVGGEALSSGDCAWLFEEIPGIRIINEYGPTETVVGCCVHTLLEAPQSGRTVPIGRPIANTQIYILSKHQQVVPPGVVGEMYIGGAGLARGYVNDAVLTAERFVPDPFSGRAGTRLYRTGDLARQSADGSIEFVGRSDEEVKIRGYRVDLREIKAVLEEHEGVGDAAVIAREHSTGDKRLVAYVVPRIRKLSEQEYRLPNGLTIFHKNKVETDYLYDEIFEKKAYFQHGIEISEDACVLDVGANIGMFTLFVGQYCPRGRIFAFEPIKATFEDLQKNKAFCAASVRAFPIGISDKTGTSEFIYYPRYTMMSGQSLYIDTASDIQLLKQILLNQRQAGSIDAARLLEHADELLGVRFERQSCTAEVKTLSEVIREEAIERIDLLKVDVECAELDVLRGLSSEDWKKIDQIVMEVHDGPMPDGNRKVGILCDTLQEYGYQVVIEQEESLTQTNLFKLYAAGKQAKKRTGVMCPIGNRVLPARTELTAAEIRQHLQKKLPDYMMPSAFVFLETLPLNPNGKLDPAALPPQESSTIVGELDYRAPRTAIEEVICGIWSDVLGLDRIGTDDNFFELGGHSLLMTQVVSRISQVFQIKLPLRDLFEIATVSGISARIERERHQARVENVLALRQVRRGEVVPLSYAQQRLWFLDQLMPGEAFYNIPIVIRLNGELDRGALERGLNEIVRRHEALRTHFVNEKGSARQVIESKVLVKVGVTDLSEWESGERDREVDRLIEEEAVRVFDLGKGPLLRVGLVRTGKQEHVLLFTMHHIVSDGWSMGVLVRELETLYGAYVQGEEPGLTALAIQYADFAVWQREWLEGEVLEQQLSYWRERLRDAVMLELPTDRPRPLKLSYEAGAVYGVLSEELTAKLRALSQREEVTLFMTLLASFQVVMHRYSGQEDIVVGSPIANRNQPDIEPLIGFFVNTLALRTDLSGNPRFRELLKQEREVCLGAYAHQDLPFEKLVAELHPTRDLSRNPLFQVLFLLQNTPQKGLALKGLRVSEVETAVGTTRFDLECYVREVGAELQVRMVYSKDLYERATVERLLQHYTTVLEGVVEDAEQRIGDLPLLGESERHELVAKWNETEREVEERALPELFEEQVERTPDAVAVVFEEANLSYRELNARANQLAWYLREQGVGPEDCVGVCLERSIEMLVGVLGVVKAGGVYVPLDPRYPFERLTHMVRDSGVKLILTLDDICNGIGLKEAARCVPLDADWASISKCSRANPGNRAQRANLACILYPHQETCPVGVGNSYGEIVDALLDAAAIEVQSGDTVLHAEDFDSHGPLLGLFHVWCHGACLIIQPWTPPGSGNLSNALSYLPVSQALVSATSLSLLLSWMKNGRRPRAELKYLNFGEPISDGTRTTFVNLLPHSVLVEMFSMPEALCITLRETGYALPLSTNVGQPVGHTRLYVADKYHRLAPVGTAGELCIGSSKLSRGYFGRPAQTAQFFVGDPFIPKGNSRLYRTGRRARYLTDGSIQLMDGGTPELILELDSAADKPEKRETAILAAPLSRFGIPPGSTADQLELTETEATLCRMWSELLEIEHVSVHDDFFEIGGHSLLVLQIISRVRDAFGVEVAVQTLFETPTIAALAEQIEKARISGEMRRLGPVVPRANR